MITLAKKDVEQLIDYTDSPEKLFAKKCILRSEFCNKEKTAEEYGAELKRLYGVTPDAEEIAAYNRDLEWLKNERAKHPGVPISYEIKYSWFD